MSAPDAQADIGAKGSGGEEEDIHPREFERRPMVAWFNPPQLAATAYRAVMASVFGAYADKRDVMAAGRGAKVHDDLAQRSDVWIDFIADVGDGWSSTYSMAWLLGQESLGEENGLPARMRLDRGDLLVLGGDEVYPTATRDEYWQRFVGPYTASLPYVDEAAGAAAPQMFAIPGNHDWYDGLASFTRLFCQERWIGGRRTRQSRSYFALQLPHDWWLWGIDTQLHSDLDLPQLEYFTSIATGQHTAAPREDFLRGHRIILCVPSPDWVATAEKGAAAYDNLDFLDRKIVRAHGGEVALTLTGDIHHYAHYEEVGGTGRPEHKITAGGGGAYTRATHQLPDALELGREKRRFRLRRDSTFPNTGDSLRLVRAAAWSFLGKRDNWPFMGLMASLYLWFGWLLQSTSRMLVGSRPEFELTFLEVASGLGWGEAGTLFGTFLGIAVRSPVVALTAALIVGALVAFAVTETPWKRALAGVVHGTVHILVALLSMWLLAWLLDVAGWGVDDWEHFVGFILGTLAVGALAGGAVMGAYLPLANLVLGVNENEVLSCQGNPDFKNFVRMHLDDRGGLTVYPLGVRSVLPDGAWEENARALHAPRSSGPWWTPRDGVGPAVRVLGAPIRIAPTEAPSPTSGGSTDG